MRPNQAIPVWVTPCGDYVLIEIAPESSNGRTIAVEAGNLLKPKAPGPPEFWATPDEDEECSV